MGGTEFIHSVHIKLGRALIKRGFLSESLFLCSSSLFSLQLTYEPQLQRDPVLQSLSSVKVWCHFVYFLIYETTQSCSCDFSRTFVVHPPGQRPTVTHCRDSAPETFRTETSLMSISVGTDDINWSLSVEKTSTFNLTKIGVIHAAVIRYLSLFNIGPVTIICNGGYENTGIILCCLY